MPIAFTIHAWPATISDGGGSRSNRKTRHAAPGSRDPHCAASVASRTVAVTFSAGLRDSTSTTIEPSMPDPPRTRTFVMQTPPDVAAGTRAADT